MSLTDTKTKLLTFRSEGKTNLSCNTTKRVTIHFLSSIEGEK